MEGCLAHAARNPDHPLADIGAGSGRAGAGLLPAGPRVTVTAVDIYNGYYGIDDNTPERFMVNARIAGVADRADAVVGDARQLPLGTGEYDVSSVRSRSNTSRAMEFPRRCPKRCASSSPTESVS